MITAITFCALQHWLGDRDTSELSKLVFQVVAVMFCTLMAILTDLHIAGVIR